MTKPVRPDQGHKPSVRETPESQIRSGRIGHALKRCRERYQVNLTRAEYDQLCRLVHDPDRRSRRRALLLAHESQRRSWWCFEFRGQLLVAIWDADYQLIRTFMPMSAYRPKQNKFQAAYHDDTAVPED